MKRKQAVENTGKLGPPPKRAKLSNKAVLGDALPPEELKAAAQALAQQRRALPIFTGREALLDAIEKNKSVVIVGETGSGKTTQIPQFLLEGRKERPGLRALLKGRVVGVTQPRRVAATTVAARVATEAGVNLGGLVGYQVRFEDATSPTTRLKYMTDGILLREAILDPTLSRYSVIILDEAHERTLHTDILFGLLKKIQRTRDDLRIVVMSATLDAELFSEYFEGASILYAEGRQYPVDVFYTEEPQSDVLDATVSTILQINKEEAPGDILVFLTGREEIEAMAKLLEEHAENLPFDEAKLIVKPLFAALPKPAQEEAFSPVPEGCRKVILSTNIAETSVTINGIRYVIDPGMVKARGFNPRIGLDSLVVVPVSKAQARQRAGRAGREAPGKVYRLYTEATFDKLDDTTVPEIKRTNLANVVLQLKALGIDNVLAFDYLDPPPREALGLALEHLYALGALDDEGNLLDAGRKMAEFPLAPAYSKCIIDSEKFDCTGPILSIVAMLSVEAIFYVPNNKREAAASAKKRLFMPEGDHLTLLNVYSTYKSTPKSARSRWCSDHFVSQRAMKKVEDIREQILNLCIAAKMHVDKAPWKATKESVDAVRRCLTSGCFSNTAILQPDSTYRTLDFAQTVGIHPTSVLFGRKKPACVLYNELVLTTKKYLRDVTTIDAAWLPELAPNFYEATAAPDSEDTYAAKGRKAGFMEEKKHKLKNNLAVPLTSNPFNS